MSAAFPGRCPRTGNSGRTSRAAVRPERRPIPCRPRSSRCCRTTDRTAARGFAPRPRPRRRRPSARPTIASIPGLRLGTCDPPLAVSPPAFSEVRLLRYRYRLVVAADHVGRIVLGACDLDDLTLELVPPLIDGKRRGERDGILDGDDRLQRLAGVDELEPLDDVELLGMRRAPVVDGRLAVQSDGIDDERVAFIVADGFAVPGRLGIRRVLAVHIDAPHGVVALPDQIDHVLRLDEE